MKLKISLILLFLLLTPSLQPLLQWGFFPMHDDQQVVRLYQLDKALMDGHFPVRWVSDLGFGFGYPLFVFYPPLIYYLGWIYYTFFFGIGYITAIKLVFATSFIAAAVSMFYWCRYHFGTWAGIVGALFYTYAPYRSVDAYVRGALAEAFSFVWLPLILLAMDRLMPKHKPVMVKETLFQEAEVIDIEPEKTLVDKLKDLKQSIDGNKVWILVLGLSWGGLMLTHNLIVLPFSLLMIVYFLLQISTLRRQYWWTYTRNLILAGLIGLGVSAFFWIPALAEKQFTIVDDILLEERYDYTLHFVYPDQLWNSIWGYGGSTEGRLDGMSFKIGKLHIVVSLFVALVSLAIVLIRLSRNRLKNQNLLWWPDNFFKQSRFVLTLSVLFGLSAWMTLDWSLFIWQNLPALQFLQFPWRFLTFTTLFSSALVAATVPLVILCWQWLWQANLFRGLRKFDPVKLAILSLVAPRLGKLIGFYYLVILTVLLLIPNLKLFQPESYLQVTDEHYTDPEFVSWTISRTSFEFVPRGVETTIQEDLQITQLAIDPEDLPEASVEVLNGTIELEMVENLTHKKRLNVVASTIGQIQFNTFNFPGWTLYIDGQEMAINDENRLKLITALIPEGEYQILLIFENTPIRLLANQITSITIGLVLGYLLLPTILRSVNKNSKFKLTNSK